MKKTEKDKLSKQLLPLIMLLMLVILITVIASNLKQEQQKPLAGMAPIPEAPPSSINIQVDDLNKDDSTFREEEIIQTAIKKYRLGQIKEAEEDFRTILVFDPNHQTALSYLGSIFFAQKQFQEAELLFRRATIAYPGNPIAFRNLALTEFKLNKTKDALETMQKAADLSPDNVEIQIAMARLYAYSGDAEQADKYLLMAKRRGKDISGILQEDVFTPIRTKLKAGR